MKRVDEFHFNDEFGNHLRRVLRQEAGQVRLPAGMRRQMLARATAQAARHRKPHWFTEFNWLAVPYMLDDPGFARIGVATDSALRSAQASMVFRRLSMG